MVVNATVRKVIFWLAVIACLTPWVSAPVALLLGLLVAQISGHPYLQHNKKATTQLLQISVVGLGFGMNLQTAMQAGKQGFVFTVISILGTLILGYLLGKALKIDRKTSHLVSSGTAICGGSAIAAVSPVINANEQQISVALGIVFILNSVALFIFPPLGHLLHLSQQQFGIWSAIAIHDTSSVVGAASKYGAEALGIATTVKLTRALWIIPVALGTAFFFKSKEHKIKIPWFIGYYIIAMCINTYLPQYLPGMEKVTPVIVEVAKKGLTLTLFLIGCGLSKKNIQAVGIRPFIQGIVLWVAISVSSLFAVLSIVG